MSDKYQRFDTIIRTLKYLIWFTSYCHMKDKDFDEAEKFRMAGFSYDFETTLSDDIRVLASQWPSVGVLKNWVAALEAENMPEWTKATEDESTWPPIDEWVMLSNCTKDIPPWMDMMDSRTDTSYWIGCYWRPLGPNDTPPEQPK